MVTPEGEFGYGPASFALGETHIFAYHELDPQHDKNDPNIASITYIVVDVEAVHVETGEHLLVLDMAPVVFELNDAYRQYPLTSEFLSYGSHCAELVGWSGHEGGAYWAFGARRVETVPAEE